MNPFYFQYVNLREHRLRNTSRDMTYDLTGLVETTEPLIVIDSLK